MDSEIQKGLYTSGGELMDYYNNEYVGAYHLYIGTGEIFSENDYIPNKSIPLKPLIRELSNKTIKEYLDTNSGTRIFGGAEYGVNTKIYTPGKYISPTSHYPNVTEEDYNRGYIDRFFIKKRNDRGNNVFEINDITYKSISKNGPVDGNLYIGIQLPWKISGPLNDVKDHIGITTIHGVKDTNRRLIAEAELKFKGIKNYLTDLLEFARLK